MGDVNSSFSLTEAKYVAGDNIKHVVLENVQNASHKVRSKQENIAGVKLPKFEYFSEGETKNDLTGLARGGQQVQTCRAANVKAIEVLVELALLQTSFLTFDEAIKPTNRRVKLWKMLKKIQGKANGFCKYFCRGNGCGANIFEERNSCKIGSQFVICRTLERRGYYFMRL
ncbi:hypothetical protein ACFE04_000321 [Oxalis oulophora]